jgi:mannose-6-phosphate isomerase
MENNHYIENRPWGSYEILSEFKVNEPGFLDSCIKKITVLPGKRLSYQSHKQRNEHWFVVQGRGVVILNDKEIPVKVGSSVDIKIGDKHRVANTSKDQDLIFIESQTGHYDEEDIERFEDDFGRA